MSTFGGHTRNEAALSYNPNWVQALHALARCKFFTGSMEEVIPLEEQAIRLSPRDAGIGGWYRQIGLVHMVQLRTKEAAVLLEKARNAAPAHPNIRAHLASAYALAGDTERASAELAEARWLNADDRHSSLARLWAVEDFGVLAPKARTLLEATYIAGLRKAGMPEEWPLGCLREFVDFWGRAGKTGNAYHLVKVAHRSSGESYRRIILASVISNI